MKKSIYLLSLICLVSFSCKTTKNATAQKTPSQKPKEAVVKETPAPKVANPAIAEGKSLYEQHCGTCHKLKNPQDFTQEELNKVVPNMVGKTNKKAGSEVISAEKQKALMTYLLASCKK